jgi:hypothetical protein
MISIIKKTAFNILDTLAWKTDRKIVVLESDDWGSIRMPSYETYQHCINKGYQADKNVFSKYDALASEDDLTMLFDVLLKFKDVHGNHPLITANCLVTNPDFEKIKENGFQKYEYELITETFKKYPKHDHCFDLWQKGFDEGIFIPQSHGREHLNVSRFMTDLQANNPHAHFAFQNKMPGIFDPKKLKEGNNYVVSLEYINAQDEQAKCDILKEGLTIFEKLFGFKSETFIATNYIWSPKMENTLAEGGVQTLQGSRFQLIPKGNYQGFQNKVHYTGQKNKNNQQYWVRNVYFEPSLNFDKDWVNSTSAEIEKAFSKKLPALISTHRINFVGFIEEANRDRSLSMLNELLKNILKKWPDAEFMSSNQLSHLMINNHNSN